MTATAFIPKWVTDPGQPRQHGATLFEPAAVLPSQFHTKPGADPAHAALFLAVLMDALKCLRGHVSVGGKENADKTRQHRRREAGRWFAADEPDWVFSFVSVCDILGLDAEAVRHALPRLMAEGTTGRLRGNVKYVRSQAHERV